MCHETIHERVTGCKLIITVLVFIFVYNRICLGRHLSWAFPLFELRSRPLCDKSVQYKGLFTARDLVTVTITHVTLTSKTGILLIPPFTLPVKNIKSAARLSDGNGDRIVECGCTFRACSH